MVGSCGHSKNGSQKERATSLCHEPTRPAVGTPARSPPGQRHLGQCDTLGGETYTHRSGPSTEAVVQWPPLNREFAPSLLTHTNPMQYWGCLVLGLTSRALQWWCPGRGWTEWGCSESRAHGRDGVLEGAVAPRLASDPSTQFAPSAPLPHLMSLSLLIQQKALTSFICSGA